MKNLKSVMLACVLVSVFAFTTPLWAGCGKKAKTDAEVVNTVISNTQTTVTKMFSDATNANSASNDAQTIPAFSLDIGELKNNLQSNLPFTMDYFGESVDEVEKTLELAKSLSNDKNYELGTYFKTSMSFTSEKLSALNSAMYPRAIVGEILGKINLDKSAKQITLETYTLLTEPFELESYSFTTVTYNDDYKVTSFNTIYSQRNEDNYSIAYGEGTSLSTLKAIGVKLNLNAQNENVSAQRRVFGDGVTQPAVTTDVNAPEYKFAVSVRTAHDALAAKDTSSVKNFELNDVIFEGMKKTADIFPKLTD